MTGTLLGKPRCIQEALLDLASSFVSYCPCLLTWHQVFWSPICRSLQELIIMESFLSPGSCLCVHYLTLGFQISTPQVNLPYHQSRVVSGVTVSFLFSFPSSYLLRSLRIMSGCLFIICISCQSVIRDLSVLLMGLAHGRGSINTWLMNEWMTKWESSSWTEWPRDDHRLDLSLWIRSILSKREWTGIEKSRGKRGWGEWWLMPDMTLVTGPMDIQAILYFFLNGLSHPNILQTNLFSSCLTLN